MDWHTKPDPFTMTLVAKIGPSPSGWVGKMTVAAVNETQPQASPATTMLVFSEPDIPMPWEMRCTITTTPAKAGEDLRALKPVVMERFHAVHPGTEVSWPDGWPSAQPVLFR